MKRTTSCLLVVPLLLLGQIASAEEDTSAEEEPSWAANSAAPDGQWELRLMPAGEEKDAAFVIVKRATQQTAVELSNDTTGPYPDTAEILWAPDSKRFAFQFKPAFRVGYVQFFQLDRDTWHELAAPHEDDSPDARVWHSIRAQRKKLNLPPNQSGRPISGTCEVRRWLDPATALLFVEKSESHEIGNQLESVGDSCFLTLKFERNGRWKITRTRLLSQQKRTPLNKAEQDELAKMDSEGSN